MHKTVESCTVCPDRYSIKACFHVSQVDRGMQQIACYLHKRIRSCFKVPFIVEYHHHHHPAFAAGGTENTKSLLLWGKFTATSDLDIWDSVLAPESFMVSQGGGGGLVIEYDTVGVLLLSALEGVVSLFQICDHRQQTNRDAQDYLSPHVARCTI